MPIQRLKEFLDGNNDGLAAGSVSDAYVFSFVAEGEPRKETNRPDRTPDDDPFGADFDTAYVYGPTHSGCVGLGLRLTMR